MPWTQKPWAFVGVAVSDKKLAWLNASTLALILAGISPYLLVRSKISAWGCNLPRKNNNNNNNKII